MLLGCTVIICKEWMGWGGYSGCVLAGCGRVCGLDSSWVVLRRPTPANSVPSCVPVLSGLAKGGVTTAQQPFRIRMNVVPLRMSAASVTAGVWP
jgi:hypothetical protein